MAAIPICRAVLSKSYPGGNFDYHIAPFKTAIDNGLRVIMPYYGIPVGQTDEAVAMTYNRKILTDLLRDQLGFEGVVCNDWGVLTSRAWGVEALSLAERFARSIEAGVDQYGGESDTQILLDLVLSGVIDEARIDRSVMRILKNKFALGLFEQRYVNEARIAERVMTADYVAAGIAAQGQSLVLLKNQSLLPAEISSAGVLPLPRKAAVYVDGMDTDALSKFAEVVDNPAVADYVIASLGSVYNGRQLAGSDLLIDRILSSVLPDDDLRFSNAIVERLRGYAELALLIVLIDLNRPAVLGDIQAFSDALIGTFGVEDRVALEVIFGDQQPTGQLPFELPASMAAVRGQLEDLPDDSQDPTYPFGHGLRYPNHNSTLYIPLDADPKDGE